MNQNEWMQEEHQNAKVTTMHHNMLHSLKILTFNFNYLVEDKNSKLISSVELVPVEKLR